MTGVQTCALPIYALVFSGLHTTFHALPQLFSGFPQMGTFLLDNVLLRKRAKASNPTKSASEPQLMAYMSDQPGNEHNEKSGAKAPVGDSVEEIELGRLQLSPS